MSKVHHLGESESIFNQFIAEIRDSNVQTDRIRFRRNIERIGEIFAYEISKLLDHEDKEVQTSLGVSNCRVIASLPIVFARTSNEFNIDTPLERRMENTLENLAMTVLIKSGPIIGRDRRIESFINCSR